MKVWIIVAVVSNPFLGTKPMELANETRFALTDKKLCDLAIGNDPMLRCKELELR